jgi:Condensation domain
MDRRLGSNERIIWSYQQIRPMHFVTTANIIGKLHFDKLQQALIKVQQRHPLLNVQIVLDQSESPWFTANSTQIPIRLIQRNSEQQWQKEVEQELANPFDWNEAPLIRVVLLQDNDVSDLIITCDHSIADGRSVVFLLRDILQAIGLPHEPLNNLPPQQNYEQLVSRAENNKLSFEPSLSAMRSKPKLPQNSRPRLHAWSLSKIETIELINKCKEAGTSVHAAICAAFLLAIAEQGSPKISLRESAILKCLSPIDVREFLPAIDEDFGFYFTTIVTTSNVTADLSLWDLARQVKDQLYQRMTPTQIFTHIPDTEGFISTLPSHEDTVNMMETVNDYDVLVSNLGHLTIPNQYGELQLAAVYGPALMSHIDQDLVVGVTTLDNKMFFSLVYSELNILTSQIEQLKQKAMELLLL